MAELLKNMFFQRAFAEQLASDIYNYYELFNIQKFLKSVFDDQWENLELKARMRHITKVLGKMLPQKYEEALAILLKTALNYKGFDAMVFPDFVEVYGQNDPENSLPALAEFTKCCSSEFAIRPFIISDQIRTLQQMQRWAEDEDEAVRRLASEGCRPRLPWARALPGLKKDPEPILPILEKLKDDPSETVRRSVANNLNDISKDHPDIVISVIKKWQNENIERERLIKHACRGLLKAGNPEVLMIFGFADPADILVENWQSDLQNVKIGLRVKIQFDLNNTAKTVQKLRLEYVVYFRKKNGISRKVFQIKEGIFKPGLHHLAINHSFQERTTRRHYPGDHKIAIIVNGIEKLDGIVTLF